MDALQLKMPDLKEKYGGDCALCGDHLTELWAAHVAQEGDYPVCHDCNVMLMNTGSIEDYREYLSRLIDGLRDSGRFRTAQRFGLINAVNKKIVFHFEQFLIPGLPDDQVLARNLVSDRTHIHATLMISYLKLQSGWFFWDFDYQRWTPATNQTRNALVKPCR